MKIRVLAIFFILLLLCGCGAKEKNGDLNCHVQIDCLDVLEHPETLKEEKSEIIPKDGIFFAEDASFSQGETVYEVLIRVLQNEKLQYEKDATNYILAVGNLYSGDCGELSGWLYRVNGESPIVGITEYVLQDGDEVRFYFVTDFTKEF